MTDLRYGVYYLPAEGSALAAFGASWLGWDVAAGSTIAHPEVPVDVAAITSTPRIYGFHGTLKPPFRLRDGTTVSKLESAVAAVAATHSAFDAPPLRLARLGSFLALIPSADSAELAGLATDCVQSLDPFRAPPSEAELSKRRASGLTPRQEELLIAWGYPYVMDQFRFHLTLTGKLDSKVIDAAETVLTGLTAGFTASPLSVREICLVQQAKGAPFRLLHRYPLTG